MFTRVLIFSYYKCSVVELLHAYHKSKYKKVGVLPIWIVKSNVSSVGRNNVSCCSLTKGPRLKRYNLLSISAVNQQFYISICIGTLPTQHTTFIEQNVV